MASICKSSSSTEEEIERNETALPGSSSSDSELESHTASNVFSDGESQSENEQMKTNETDAPGSSNAEEKKYKCPQCPKQYKYKSLLIIHMRIHDKNKRIPCEFCDDKFFAKKQKLDKHMLSHTGEKLHECPTCNRWFRQLANLKRHQFLHLEDKTFKCPECPVDVYFQTPQQLSDHMLVQHKEKQHECSICHMKFHRRGVLKEHQLVHTKVKAFQCGTCYKQFNRSGNLNVHIRSHLGVEPYKCEICDKGFTDSSAHKRHQKICARHMEKRQHKCPKCPKSYSHKGDLTRHMKTHNKETTN